LIPCSILPHILSFFNRHFPGFQIFISRNLLYRPCGVFALQEDSGYGNTFFFRSSGNKKEPKSTFDFSQGNHSKISKKD